MDDHFFQATSYCFKFHRTLVNELEEMRVTVTTFYSLTNACMVKFHLISYYQLPVILTALLYLDRINVAYLTACAFIRSS